MKMWETGDTDGLDALFTADVIYEAHEGGAGSTIFEGLEDIERYIKHVHVPAPPEPDNASDGSEESGNGRQTLHRRSITFRVSGRVA